MATEMEKPRVTEIKVRMDCNGCVQKIKKALHGIPGIYDIDVDFSEQKISITGWAEPEKLVKAIRKTRKSAVICIHTEQSDETGTPAEGENKPEEGAQPPQEPTNSSAETTQAEAEAEAEAAAAPAESPDEPPETQNPPPSNQPPTQKDGVHTVYHHPPDHGYLHHPPDHGYHHYPYGPTPPQGYGGQWNAYHGGPGFRGELYQPPQPVYVQSYNTYRPSPYVTEYAYPRSPPGYSFNGRPDDYSSPEFRGEPPQLIHATHSYNTYKPSPYVTRYAHPQSPPRYLPCGRPENYGNLGFRGDPCQPPYAAHNYSMYKPSPYVTEYAYPQSPPRYLSHSIPDHYNRDYNSGNYENVTSMFSEENPNACRIV